MNTLITKLDAVIDNSNLETYKSLILYRNPTSYVDEKGFDTQLYNDSADKHLYLTGETTLEILTGNAVFYDETKTNNLGTKYAFKKGEPFYILYADTNEVQMKVYDATKLQTIARNRFYPISTKKLKYLTNLTQLQISYANMEYCCVDDLTNLVNMTSILMNDIKVTGDIKSLAALPLLCSIYMGESSLTGTMEDFVEARYAATGGEPKLPITISMPITLNGEKLDSLKRYVAEGSGDWAGYLVVENTKTVEDVEEVTVIAGYNKSTGEWTYVEDTSSTEA